MVRHSPDSSLPPEMVALMRDKDWSKTLLGPSDTWSPSLKLTVNLMLASGFPMAIRWGADFVMIYNDGYRAILGDKHPAALGKPFRETWPEVQPTLGPLHAAILNGESGALFAEDLLLRIQRRGADWEDARFTVSYSPIPDQEAATGVGGVLITAVETTGRVRTEDALRSSEERFSGLFQQTGVGVIQSELDGRFLLANKRFCEIVGRSSDELLNMRVPDITHPEDRDKDTELRRRLVEDGVPFNVEKRYLRPDGSYVWVSVNVALMRNPDGKPGQLIGIVRDITDRKRAQAQQELLMGELNHRIKNLFAITGSIVSLSARSASTPKEYADNLRGRLDALSSAHDLIMPRINERDSGAGQPATLDILMQRILKPYLSKNDINHTGRCFLEGLSVPLGPRTVTTFALILHELATNAAKYGSLSVEEGSLAVAWSRDSDALVINWKEVGGPAISGPPKSKGFGTILSNNTIRDQLGGSIDHRWNDDGLSVELSIPLDRLNQ